MTEDEKIKIALGKIKSFLLDMNYLCPRIALTENYDICISNKSLIHISHINLDITIEEYSLLIGKTYDLTGVDYVKYKQHFNEQQTKLIDSFKHKVNCYYDFMGITISSTNVTVSFFYNKQCINSHICYSDYLNTTIIAINTDRHRPSDIEILMNRVDKLERRFNNLDISVW